MQYRILPLLLMMASSAVPASAQTLSLTIQDGLVNLDASGASIRQILDAWSRVGGTKIVNGERLTGGNVTLKLVNQPERQALETILRSAAGYMAIPRAADATPGSSMFDRIMVLPTSTAPQGTAPRAAGAGNTPPNPFLRGRRTDDGDEPAQQSENEDPVQPPVFTFPNQGQTAGDPAAQGNPFMQNNGANPQGSPFGAPSQQQPTQQQFGSPTFGTTNPFMPQQPQQPQQANPFAPQQPQPVQTPFGQVQQPMVNPFAAAAGAAQQQQQMFPNAVPAPAPGTFTIIGSPTPGTVAQPQPTPPGQRPPGQQE
jgi:hypothetical protein